MTTMEPRPGAKLRRPALSHPPLPPTIVAAGLPIEDLTIGSKRITRTIGGLARTLITPVTLSPLPCKKPSDAYAAGLRRTLAELRDTPLAIVPGGSAPTENAAWLELLVAALEEHRLAEGVIAKKLLSSNGSGLVPSIDTLTRYAPDLLELLRDHQKQRQNDRVMRFRPGVAIRDQAAFEQTVLAARERLPVQLAAVIQENGVHSIRCVRAYAEWASGLGVSHILFRESLDLGARDRIPMVRLIEDLFANHHDRSAFEPLGVVVGSHHYSVRMRWENSAIVNFESTDVASLRARQASGVLQRLVFHENGNLCGSTDPHKQVLLRTQPN